MVKDYTDYILMVLDSGDRVYHLFHLRNLKNSRWNGRIFPDDVSPLKPNELRGHRFLMNLDRAYRVKWAPWKKWDRTQSWWLVKSMEEILRSKKVGLLIFQDVGDLHTDLPIEPIHISRVHQPSGVMAE